MLRVKSIDTENDLSKHPNRVLHKWQPMCFDTFWYQFNTLSVLPQKSPATSFTAECYSDIPYDNPIKLRFFYVLYIMCICINIYTLYVLNESTQSSSKFRPFVFIPPRRNVSKKSLTLPGTNSSQLRGSYTKRKLIFQPSIFRCFCR